MKKLLGVLALSIAIPVLQAGVYNFSTLHQGTGAGSVNRDFAAGDHKNGDVHISHDKVTGDISHDVVPTPEPGFYGLMAIGFGALAVFQVRRRRQA